MSAVLHDLLARAAADNPDGPAIISDTLRVSYSELFEEARQLAGALVAAGVKPGTAVGLSIPKSVDAIVGAYGIMMAGACYVPVDPFVPPERSVRIAQNVEMRTLVTTADRLDTLATEIAASTGPLNVLTPTTSPGALPFDVNSRCWRDCENDNVELPVVLPTDLAYVLHTSGSTGVPKGVAISHLNAMTFVEMASDFFSISDQDRLCSQAPLHFDLSVFDLYVACHKAASIVLLPEYFSAFPGKMVAAIRDHQITVWNSVVSALTLMMDRGKPVPADFDSVRLALFSGEAMPMKYLRPIRNHFGAAELFNGYGQTEANTSTYYPITELPDNDDWKVPIGRAFPRYDVFAMTDAGAVAEKEGETGELYVRSDAVAQGYWGNPEETAKKFVPDPRATDDTVCVYRTGDNVRLRADGDFEFLGRFDDQVKSRGYRIELGDIQQSLLACDGIESAAVLAIPDAAIGNRLVACVTASIGASVSEASIMAHCHSSLPAYMVPEVFHIVAEIPRTSTGKIDRPALLRRGL